MGARGWPVIDVNENGEARYQRHPLLLIRDEPTERVFASELLPSLTVVERKADGQLKFKVRGQWFSNFKAARRLAG
jgi:hypothetical protein